MNLSHIECNNAECPKRNEDGECVAETSLEVTYHPSWPQSFACWYDDNKSEKEDKAHA